MGYRDPKPSSCAPDDLVMLALRDGEPRRRYEVTSGLRMTVAGASLVDLIGRGRLALGADQRLTVKGADKTGFPVLDHVRDDIRASDGRTLASWLMHFTARPCDLLERTLDGIITRGAVGLTSKRVLFFFNSKVLRLSSGCLARSVQESARLVIREGAPPEPGLALALRIAGACQGIEDVFDGDDEVAARIRIEEIEAASSADDETGRALTAVRERVAAFVYESAHTRSRGSPLG